MVSAVRLFDNSEDQGNLSFLREITGPMHHLSHSRMNLLSLARPSSNFKTRGFRHMHIDILLNELKYGMRASLERDVHWSFPIMDMTKLVS